MLDHGGGEGLTVKQTSKDLLVVADIYSAAAVQQQLQLTISAEPAKSLVEHEHYQWHGFFSPEDQKISSSHSIPIFDGEPDGLRVVYSVTTEPVMG